LSNGDHPVDAAEARQRSNRARGAAEALFARKEVLQGRPSDELAARPEQLVRKPRVLPALIRAGGALDRIVQRGRGEPMTCTIPLSHVARIKTWLDYGMTVPQVAQVYGVAVGVIQRLL